MLRSLQPLARPGVARNVPGLTLRHQRLGLASLAVRARKQGEKQGVGEQADLAGPETLPADLQKLSKLAKTELQHQLEVRGLDKDGNKEELAHRLLDNLINQESVLSTNPPDRVKLQQQLEQPAAAGPARRGRRTSRKATASADPQPEGGPKAADPVIAAAAAVAAEPEAPAAVTGPRRGRKTSRKATTSADPLPSPADMVAAAAAAAEEATAADARPTRRGRKTSRKATTSAEPMDAAPAQDPVAAAAEAAAAADSAAVPAAAHKRGRRSKTTAADPAPEDSLAAASKAGRGRRASRRSSVLEPEVAADAAPAAASADTAAPTRPRGRRSSAKTASTGPAPAEAVGSPGEAAAAPAVSRAKLLAQQLAKKEIATHGMAAAAAAGAAAAFAAPDATAAPGSAWVGADALLYAGSQAQSDALLAGGDNSMQVVGAESTLSVDNGSMDEVFAQLSAERASGLADEPALRPEATFAAGSVAPGGPALADIAAAADAEPQQYMQSLVEAPAAAGNRTDDALSAFDHMVLPPSAGAADAAAAAVDGQHPSIADCVAAVEEPLLTTAEAVVVDEAPDAAMAAFDHTSLDTPAAAAVAGGNQTPSLADIALAAEPTALPASLDESLGEDEEPDTVLAAFDHMQVPAPRAAAAPVLASADEGSAGYDQSYLDPVQSSALGASVGSGSVDLADLEAEVVVVTTPAATGAVTPAKVAAAAAAAAVAAASAAAPVKQQQQQADFGALMQSWWASVMQMFEEWQKNLSGPK